MKGYIIGSLMVLYSFVPAHSQVPGYMGKRFIFGIAAHGMPGAGYVFSDEKFLDLNIRYSLGFDYVLTKRFTIGASIQQTNDIVFLKKHTALSYLDDSYARPEEFNSAANFYGFNYGVNIKIFSFNSSGSIAPFGRYIVLEVLKNKIDINDDGRYYVSGKKELNNINTTTFILGLGSQKIFFNRIVLGASVKVGLNGYGLLSRKEEEVVYYDEITRVGSSKMFSDYIINIGFNLGLLAF